METGPPWLLEDGVGWDDGGDEDPIARKGSLNSMPLLPTVVVAIIILTTTGMTDYLLSMYHSCQS